MERVKKIGKAEKAYFGRPVKCPFPECTHVGEIITKVHCRMKHNMERDEMFKKYGEPKTVMYDASKLKSAAQHTRSLNPYVEGGSSPVVGLKKEKQKGKNVQNGRKK